MGFGTRFAELASKVALSILFVSTIISGKSEDKVDRCAEYEDSRVSCEAIYRAARKALGMKATEDLGPSGWAHLKALTLTDPKIVSLRALDKATELFYLDISGLRLSSLEPLIHLPNLQFVHTVSGLEGNCRSKDAPRQLKLACKFRSYTQGLGKTSDLNPHLSYYVGKGKILDIKKLAAYLKPAGFYKLIKSEKHPTGIVSVDGSRVTILLEDLKSGKPMYGSLDIDSYEENMQHEPKHHIAPHSYNRVAGIQHPKHYMERAFGIFGIRAMEYQVNAAEFLLTNFAFTSHPLAKRGRESLEAFVTHLVRHGVTVDNLTPRELLYDPSQNIWFFVDRAGSVQEGPVCESRNYFRKRYLSPQGEKPWGPFIDGRIRKKVEDSLTQLVKRAERSVSKRCQFLGT